jgi:hypothetical protein
MPKVLSVMEYVLKTKSPLTPLCQRGENYKELLEKSPFGKGGFRGI